MEGEGGGCQCKVNPLNMLIKVSESDLSDLSNRRGQVESIL